MSAITDATLLIQDLLSPRTTQLASTTPALISYHLSTLPLAPPTLLVTLVQSLATSPSLWKGQATLHSWEPLNYARAREVYEALKNGVLYRAGEISRELGTGWRARRRFGQFLEAFYEGLYNEEVHPAVRLILASAALRGLQLVKDRRDKLYVGGSGLMGRAEAEALKAWDVFLGIGSDAETVEWVGHQRGEYEIGTRYGDDVLPTWIAADTLASFPIKELSTGPVVPLLTLLTTSFSSIFSSGHLFDSLGSDLSPTPAGLHWNIPSPSHTLLTAIVASPLFVSLGSLSRAIGRCLEAAGLHGGVEHAAAVGECGNGTETLVKRVQASWAGSRWCDLDDADLDEATRTTAVPWTILKSLLFSLTLVQSSLLVLLTPQESTNPTELQLRLTRQSIRNLGHSYFITIKFGTEGFGAWRGVFSGLLEIAGHDEETVAELMKDLEPKRIGALHEANVERSQVTFYLNVAEQLMKALDSDYVENVLLPCCHPYLETPTHRDTFESAHSVLLALFAAGQRCARDLAPWYTRLLLSAFPRLMSAPQLRLAFTTMIRCLSNEDDALAWWCILQLIEAIKLLPSSAAPSSPVRLETTAQTVLASVDEDEEPINSGREFDAAEAPTNLSDAVPLSPLETQALELPRGHLLLALIDQTTSVNLILLRSLLEQIWEFIDREEGEGRDALVKVLFSTLGEGLDATKREEGVRWWMERGSELGPASA